MPRRLGAALTIFLAAWAVVFLGLGTSSGGVFLDSTPRAHADGSVPQPGELPACVSARVVSGRGWLGLTMFSSEVFLTGCNDSAGALQLTTGPTCSANGPFGPVPATCDASRAGRDLKVVFTANYPELPGLAAGGPTTLTFRLSPGGSYSAR